MKRGRGIAIGFKACDLAHHLDRRRQRRRRRQLHALLQHRRHGAGLRHRDGADRRRGAEHRRPRSVTVVHSDTDVTPYDMATLGSRSTVPHGQCGASSPPRMRKQKLEALRARARPAGRQQRAGRRAVPARNTACRPATIIGTGSYIPRYMPPDARTARPPNATPFWMVGATGVEIEVDTETGHVRVDAPGQRRRRRHADQSAASSRRSFPARRSCSSASRCSRRWCSTRGPGAQRLASPNTRFRACSTCRASMANEAVVEASSSTGPFGAKGVGETGTFGVSPAIANAIDDAVGVRLTDVAADRREVYRAIRAADDRSEDEMRTRRPSASR